MAIRGLASSAQPPTLNPGLVGYTLAVGRRIVTQTAMHPRP